MARLEIQFFQQFLDAQAVMNCHKLKDTLESAKTQWGVIGYSYMILTRLLGGESDVRAILSNALITQDRVGL